MENECKCWNCDRREKCFIGIAVEAGLNVGIVEIGKIEANPNHDLKAKHYLKRR